MTSLKLKTSLCLWSSICIRHPFNRKPEHKHTLNFSEYYTTKLHLLISTYEVQLVGFEAKTSCGLQTASLVNAQQTLRYDTDICSTNTNLF